MSNAATAWAWACIAAGRCVTASASLVLLRLADRADPEGTCWPGHGRTAADCALGGRTVRQALVDLEAAGLISTEPRHDACGRQKTNLYRLVGVAELAAAAVGRARTEGGGEIRHPGVAKSARGGGENRHLQGVAESATLEPQREPKRKNHHPSPSGAREKSGGGDLLFRGGGVPGNLLVILGEAGVAAERRQVLLDELDGACTAARAAGDPVRNEASYLRRLAELDAASDDGLAVEHADRIAQDRRDRAAAKRLVERQEAARLAERSALSPIETKPQPPEKTKGLVEAREYLAKIRRPPTLSGVVIPAG